MVNLIAGREVVTELVGDDMNTERARQELQDILPGGAGREQVLNGYDELIRRLGEPGAPNHAAQRMISLLQ